MEVSALRYSGGVGLHGCSPLLRLQSDERLIALIRRGNSGAFEVLVSRYHSRLLAFCRHMLGSKEDAEDVLQEVLAAAFNAILADERTINVRPWLYRIARNRSLNHLRRIQAIGVDSMDIHFSEYGATTADKVHDREQFRLLVRDIQSLPETQRTALVLREMDALSYEQIAEAIDTTVPGVKSLLVRARISLAEAAEARQLSCDEVRIELAEVAEGLRKRPPTLVRRHLRACNRCATFQGQLKQTNKVLAALLPIGPLAILRKLFLVHLGHSVGTGSGATAGATGAGTAAGAGGATGASGAVGATGAAGATSAGTLAAGQAAAVAGTAGGSAFGSAGGLISAGAGAIAGKAAAGLAAAALVTAGAVEATHVTPRSSRAGLVPQAVTAKTSTVSGGAGVGDRLGAKSAADTQSHPAKASDTSAPTTSITAAATTTQPAALTTTTSTQTSPQKPTSDHTQTQTDPTVLSSSASTSGGNGDATDATGTTTSSSSSTDTCSTGSSGSSSSSSGSTTSGSGSSSSSGSSGGAPATSTSTTTTSATTSTTSTDTTGCSSAPAASATTTGP